MISVASVEPSSDAVDENGNRVDARGFDLTKPFEHKPHFHEWATALPGMICVSRKARNSTFRNYVAAETATPTISCCACLGADDMKNFYFAGVARSKSVRPIDDGVGPSIDEFFTLAIGGMYASRVKLRAPMRNTVTLTHTHTRATCLQVHAAQQLGHHSVPGRHARVDILQPKILLVCCVQGCQPRRVKPEEGHRQGGHRRKRARHRPGTLLRQARRDLRLAS